MNTSTNEFEFTSEFNDALKTFYSYKKDYESKINKKIKELAISSELTKEEKRNKFLKLKKTCVVCGKPGGSIFIQDKNKLIAKCGNRESPCKFNIELERATYLTIAEVLHQQTAIITSYKNSIINSKLDFIHGLKSEQETIDAFEELKTNLIMIVKLYQSNYNQFLTLYNVENLPSISIETDKLIDSITLLKNFISSYEKTKDKQLIVEALEVYKEIKTINKKLLELKYKITELDTSSINTIQLVQKSYTNKDLQILNTNDNSENKIIVFYINDK